MRVLLCTPYDVGSRIASGGITIWARNIVDYYNTLNDPSISVDVQPFDRATFINENTSLARRILCGIKEYVINISQAAKYLKKHHCDIVHLNSSASLSLVKDLVMIRVAHKYGAKIVVHFHFGRIPQLMDKNNWETKLLKRVLKKADGVITMDKASFEKLRGLGYNKVSYLPNPLALNIVNLINRFTGTVDIAPRSVLFVGHVIKAKGVFELANAMNGLENSTLKIIGKCSEEMQQQLLDINSKISFGGEITHDQVIKEMLGADVFVLPSYTEGFPNVILESMACGCTIVATSVGAIPEMLGAGEEHPCGVVIPAKDSELLHEVLKNLLRDDNERLRYKESGSKRVRTLYSMDVVWKGLTGIWADCC